MVVVGAFGERGGVDNDTRGIVVVDVGNEQGVEGIFDGDGRGVVALTGTVGLEVEGEAEGEADGGEVEAAKAASAATAVSGTCRRCGVEKEFGAGISVGFGTEGVGGGAEVAGGSVSIYCKAS